MEFFRCMAEVGFTSSSPSNDFSLGVKVRHPFALPLPLLSPSHLPFPPFPPL
jgi:hypothetical protein